jgi:hypothetical protein
MGYRAGETVNKTMQRIPQSSRAVTQPRAEKELQSALARARTAGDFFGIQPDRHLINEHRFIGIASEKNQEVIKTMEAAKNKRSADEEVEKAAQ